MSHHRQRGRRGGPPDLEDREVRAGPQARAPVQPDSRLWKRLQRPPEPLRRVVPVVAIEATMEESLRRVAEPRPVSDEGAIANAMARKESPLALPQPRQDPTAAYVSAPETLQSRQTSLY